MKEYTWNDYKERISIMQVAIELGYRFDREKGRSQPHFVLHDTNGKEVDGIYIKNPQNNAIQGYWRRSLSGKESSGDLIGFIKENITSFPEYGSARNEIDAVNKVLARLSGVSMSQEYIIKNFTDTHKGWEAKPFDIGRYQREEGNVENAMKFLSLRGINRETAEMFRSSIEMIKDTESKYQYKNLAFPYRVPGCNDIVGYEVRGYGGYKGKAEGTDSTNACWMAYIGKNGFAGLVNEVHIAESALDIMAYVQINKHKLNLDECIFVSFGGSFSDKQMKGLLEAFPGAMPVLHFDNDLNGIIYDCRSAAIMAGKEMKCKVEEGSVLFSLGEKRFSIPIDNLSYNTFRESSGLREKLKVEKAPNAMKDWNDVLMVGQGQKAGEKEKAELQMKSGGRRI